MSNQNCACAVYSDGSRNSDLCSLHAAADPCATKAQVTNKRRKGTIRRGVCTNCGHGQS